MKILAIDYGKKRVGLALGDTEGGLVLPYGVLARTSDEQLIHDIEKVVLAEGVEHIVVGEPITAGGDSSSQANITREFVALLLNSQTVPVELVDERFTSQRADVATQAGSSRGRDELAALFLLQDYIERMSNTRS